MIKDLLAARLREYAPANALEQEHALAEIMQHYVLASLARAGFFSHAAFHGGTCLRILHAMNRFSEDLDFVLKAPDASFDWEPYLARIRRDCADDGIRVDAQGRAAQEAAVRKAFLKTDSIGQILSLELPFARNRPRTVRIKLEVDTNPPAGATMETRFVTFPITAAVTCMDLASGFGSKCHALLCRDYTKGRDWYDFIWYASRRVTPNLELLSRALDQQGPWAGQQITITGTWLHAALRVRIAAIDWRATADDVARFVTTREQAGLAAWSSALFVQQLETLDAAMREQG
jgi:predicted nucleotidyltransferase component of viral defense system